MCCEPNPIQFAPAELLFFFWFDQIIFYKILKSRRKNSSFSNLKFMLILFEFIMNVESEDQFVISIFQVSEYKRHLT